MLQQCRATEANSQPAGDLTRQSFRGVMRMEQTPGPMFGNRYHQIDSEILQHRLLLVDEQIREPAGEVASSRRFRTQAGQSHFAIINTESDHAIERERFFAALATPLREIRIRTKGCSTPRTLIQQDRFQLFLAQNAKDVGETINLGTA